MVIFGDSTSDTGRAFNAPAAHQFEEYGIGPAPFKRLYAAPDSDVSETLSPSYSRVSLLHYYCTVVVPPPKRWKHSHRTKMALVADSTPPRVSCLATSYAETERDGVFFRIPHHVHAQFPV